MIMKKLILTMITRLYQELTRSKSLRKRRREVRRKPKRMINLRSLNLKKLHLLLKEELQTLRNLPTIKVTSRRRIKLRLQHQRKKT